VKYCGWRCSRAGQGWVHKLYKTALVEELVFIFVNCEVTCAGVGERTPSRVVGSSDGQGKFLP
jgi:hypothetical protein